MRILIVTPTFNSEKYICECLKSVLDQSLDFSQITHVVKDGGSSDNTIGVIRSFLTRYIEIISAKKINFVVERSADSGMYDAINQGVAIGDGSQHGANFDYDLVFWLNSDDKLANDFVLNISNQPDEVRNKWFIGRALDINETGEVITDTPHSKIDLERLSSGDFNFRGGAWLRAESVAIGYDLFKKAGGLNPILKLAGDYELFVKLSRLVPPTWVDFRVKEFRLHSNQLSNDLIKYEYERFSAYRKFNENQIQHSEFKGPKPKVVFYPDYTSGNPYQQMMYQSIEAVGFQTFEKLDAYLSLELNFKKFDILHIQWLNDIMRRPHEEVVLIVEKLKTHIKNLISAGKKVIFTVHNIGSHESTNIDLEKDLTLFLFQVCAKVHVHHSIVSSQMLAFYGTLPWGSLVIAEHGPYSSTSGAQNINNLLLNFGLDVRDSYIVVPGQIRKYKDMEIIKLFINEISKKNNDLPIVMAGQFHPELSEKDKSFFYKRNVRISPIRLNDEQYNLLVQNSLFVFLSYKDISTSGSLFHAVSNDALVLAPALGTIPAYIDDGITGCLYDNKSVESLFEAIDKVFFIIKNHDRNFIINNIRKVSYGLSWSALQIKLFCFK
ncbi:hypothetical protein B9Z35_06165 [Limnohabitans sp. Jir61]|uniref:glycosyltransferase n=1 Tax=Limnohabitans sp. Jir61 TaxID=1826168 RepID=UPI000D3B7357|nr:glycosyltransferase [Limnohabitans sp. Jir61]PUE33103.1 hypothetical protein B9Z35_06165 [Limnohabitans sp. Jir61]